MLAEPIMYLLEQANIGLIGGSNLYGYFMPGDINAGVVILPSLGGNHIAYETPGWRKDDTFQVLSRASTGYAARAMAMQVQAALLSTKQQMVPSQVTGSPAILFSYIRAMHDPIIFPRQLGNQWEASVNYQASYAVQSLTVV